MGDGAFGAWGDFDNDGKHDVVLAGVVAGVEGIPDGPFTRIYRRTDSGFEPIEASLPQVSQASAAWGDYDNDGDLDLLLAGTLVTNAVTTVFRNDADGFKLMDFGLVGNDRGSVSWVDFDNDGGLDIFLAAAGRLYRNTGASFVQLETPIPAKVYGDASWGDFDNDSDMDLLLSGHGPTLLFCNHDGVFARTNLNVPTESYFATDWGDYDADGDLDIVTGTIWSGGPVRDLFVFRNNGGGVFVAGPVIGFSYGAASAAWGDYDGDGIIDVRALGQGGSYYGFYIRIIRNEVSRFAPLITQASIHNGCLAWTDIDQDRDLDVFYTGTLPHSASAPGTGFYTNTLAKWNQRPSAPRGLYASTVNGEVVLSWEAAGDAETPTMGLHYNLRVGRTPGGIEAMTPHSDIATGERRITGRGNAGPRARWALPNLPLGTYYWSVQAIDAAFAGSPFSEESSFTVTNTAPRISAVTNVSTMWNVAVTVPFTVHDRESPASELQVTAFPDTTNVVGNSSISVEGSGTNRMITVVPRSVPGLVTITVAVSDPHGAVRQMTFQVEVVSRFADDFLGLPAGPTGAAGWADYDGDRDVDLFISGHTLFRNNGSNQFVDMRAALPVGGIGSAAWGDYDNDGDLDLLNIGSATEIYRNDGTDIFSGVAAALSQYRMGTPEWKDLTGDGELDVLVYDGRRGVKAQSAHVYKSFNGTFSLAAALSGDGLTAAAADYDNDGDLDVLVGESEGSRLYANNGLGTFTRMPIMLPGVINGMVAWNDFDQDGWVDFALTGSANGANSNVISRVYRNNGDGTFARNPSPLEGVQLGGLAWADYDNDGDSDLALSGIGKDGAPITRLYWNQYGRTFFGSHANLPQMQATLAWGDVDGDTDPDLFVGGMIGTNRVCRIYRNDVGITNSAPEPPQNLRVTLVEDNGVIFEWASGLDAETSDPDGLTYNLRVGTSPGAIDVMAPAADLQTGFHRIPGPGNVRRNMWRLFDLPRGTYFWSVQTIDTGWMGSQLSNEASFTITNARPSISQLVEVRIAPFSSTNLALVVGDFETAPENLTLIVDSSDTNVLPVTSIAIEGSESNRVVTVTSGRFPGTATVTVTVVDENGARRSSSFRVYVEHFTLQPLTAAEFGARRAVWGDYDNDGDLDLAVTGMQDSNLGPGRVLRNDGGGSFLEVFAVQSSERPEWVDLNNDGYLELILTHWSNSYIYQYDQQRGFVRLDQPLAPVRGISVVDYDNDGDFDVMQKGPAANGPFFGRVITRLFRNDRNHVFTEIAGLFPNVQSNGAMEWNDYDYDGDWDLLLGGYIETQPLWLYRNDTHGVFTESLMSLPWDSTEASWIDYDNDRLVDMVMAGPRVFKNLGNSFSNASVAAGLCCGNNGVWGDFDGDGWHDVMIAAPGLGGFQPGRIFRNLRNGNFALTEGALPSVADDGSAWGDYDNDGDLDLVLVGSMAKLVRNNSPSPNVLPAVPTNLSATVLSGGQVLLNWSPSTDLGGVWASITYNLRVGTRPGGIDVMSPEADLATGWRRVARVGNAGATNFWKLWLPPGQYYWSVQAIDSSFAGSGFSAEGMFVITAPVIVQHGISSGRMALRFSGAAGFQYSVQVSSDLMSWSLAGGASEVSSGVFEFIDTAGATGSRFYRISSP